MKLLDLRHSATSRRSGFTLLELILAVGLTSVLMAAVYGAMSAYWNLALDSHKEITRTQIARSLMKQLSRDIQSCTFKVHGTQTNDSSDIDGTDSDRTESGTSTYGNGLIGTPQDLVLYISYPSRGLNYVNASDAVGNTNRDCDLMVVRWLLAESNGGGLASALAEKYTYNSENSVAGLARGSGGVIGFGGAIENDNISLQMESTTLLAREVHDILFEYFDGGNWLSEWDSSLTDKMPRAVRIKLTLRTPLPSDGSNTGSPTDQSKTIYSLVVPVPVASPYVEDQAI